MTTSDNYPYLKVRCRVRHWGAEVWALVDTGFDGHLIIPRQIARQLGAPDSVAAWAMADGRRVVTSGYRGIVELVGVGAFPSTVVALGDEYIIGRAVIDRLRVTFDHGQRLIVEP